MIKTSRDQTELTVLLITYEHPPKTKQASELLRNLKAAPQSILNENLVILSTSYTNKVSQSYYTRNPKVSPLVFANLINFVLKW